MDLMILFFIKSFKYPSNYFNINDYILVVLYPQDLAQVSNQVLFDIVFIFVGFLDSGIHCQVLIFPFPQILLNKNFRDFYGNIS